MRILTVLALLLTTATSAWSLDKPTGPVVLTVRGAVSNANAGNTAQFDMAMLDKLTGRTGRMKTPWTEGETEFKGPLLRAVLEAAGAKGNVLLVRALNDYFATVPMEDATAHDTMLATRANGKLLSVRDKGPLFLIYPFDLEPALYNEKFFSRSVWQIKEIEVQP
ncbi:hypothetical protein SAMN05880590_11362 [Rhizobium sp. RU35A]|uniref:Molybdopterin-dependent oxidoreductase n=1 Tax=Rhizobium straminoryzae TaxID=1387186 RepID=A0A549T2T4_9HYPH|nr:MULTISPECIES: molybdopterin-dependent oxidoreductase [Rhizobium]TRL36170.1 molybdopterin-dependent oxidoreductase [Rhizobium straminoryzae]SIR17872.1 hypothetical protein SAMN05880590_11362 [Rhizobium sp. RU35A]